MPERENSLSTHSVEETLDLGARLGRAAVPGEVIALFGGLGAGKTVLAKGIMRGLGGNPDAVTSPTFTLMVRHEARLPLYHIDAYRLSGARELMEIGVEEAFGSDGLAVIEWAERAMSILPKDRLDIYITVLDEKARLLRLDATGPRARAMLDRAGLSR